MRSIEDKKQKSQEKASGVSNPISSHLDKATLATSALLPRAIDTLVDEEPAQQGQTNANETFAHVSDGASLKVGSSISQKKKSAKGKILNPRASEGRSLHVDVESPRDGLQPYRSLSEFTFRHSLTLPKGHVYNAEYPWRLTSKAPNGQIIGLDKFSGKAIATNGILVAIESETGFVRIGHMQWFEVFAYDEDSANELPTARHPKKPRYTAEEVDMLLE